MADDSKLQGAFNILFAFSFVGVIGASFLANWLNAPYLEIVASAIEADQKDDVASDGWVIRGKVLYDGSPVRSAKVWAIARDSQGNRFAPKTTPTNDSGEFEIETFPKIIGNAKDKGVTEVSIFAKSKISTKKKNGKVTEETVEGEEQLGLGGGGRTRWIKLPPAALVFIPTVFFASLLLGLFRFRQGSTWLKVQYFGSVTLGIIFTITMVAYLSVGLYKISASASPGDALSLGFATIFQGTYVANVEPEWLFSLTAPGPVTESAVTGMGAPLWVLLLSVLGSGVFTISLMVGHINKELQLEDPVKVGGLVQEIVKHQFYVFFSPLGAVFVYQFLVAAGAASQGVTVGTAAIAAGVSLNVILDKSIKYLADLLGS